jgi:glycosyltransferase involved in cell wall biosynthesis
MAAGKAVVSTTVGAEGLPAEPDRHLLIADGAEAFAAAVVRVHRDPALRHAIERDARALVLHHYDWAVAAARLERSLTDAAPATAGVAASFVRPHAAARISS